MCYRNFKPLPLIIVIAKRDFWFLAHQVPVVRCELQVSGLSTGEKYVCAVAAYTADGKLIGDSIGESTRPILAAHPMPVLMCWAYLCQV